uniref:Protein kinase domain-containing protein n=1 Tax=Aegilops tauschii subsp. strangulata TaxID=200361 RepID=A0A453JE92_AEGTS
MVRGGSMRRPSLALAAVSEPAAPEFTLSADDYRLMEEVGFGANAVVYRAIFLPANRTIAVKCLDLDRINSNLVRQELSLFPSLCSPIFQFFFAH